MPRLTERCAKESAKHQRKPKNSNRKSVLSSYPLRKRERIEVLMAIKHIGVLRLLEPVNYEVGQRSSQNLVTNLQEVPGQYHIPQRDGRDSSSEGQQNDKSCVDTLAHDGRNNGPCPQQAAVCKQLELRHRIGVSELASPECDKARCENPRNEAEYCREGLLVMPSGSRRQSNRDNTHQVEQRRAEEP